MSSSFVSSKSSSFSFSDAKVVIGKICDDLYAIKFRGFDQFRRNPAEINLWIEIINFMMEKQDLASFQIQFTYGSPTKNVALQYDILADGSIKSDSESGKINYYQFPEDTTLSLVVSTKGNFEVAEFLEKKGWTHPANYIEGETQNAGSYSKNDIGTNRNKKGLWEQ